MLPPASEGWGKVMFSLCLSVHTRGYTSPRFFLRSLVRGPFLGGRYPSPRQDWSTPRTGEAASSTPRADFLALCKWVKIDLIFRLTPQTLTLQELLHSRKSGKLFIKQSIRQRWNWRRCQHPYMHLCL